ncbi:MAG: hypothetical protein AAF597_17325 [Bacteroidota bacterium]
MPERLAIIGLHQEEFTAVKDSHFGPIIHHEYLPKIAVYNGKLFVERANGSGMLPVDKVVYYGIFEDDLDFITGLALWGGPCFPNPQAMMDCRLKLPCLARALRHTKFGGDWRGYASADTTLTTEQELVAKWGNWHCGENKVRFNGSFQNETSSIIEPYYPGEAVRIVLIGDQYWQVRLTGDTWLKSIHPASAGYMPVDNALLEDSRNIRAGLGLDFLGNDYIVTPDGDRYLLEVNHIPNVTRFEEMRLAYLEEVRNFIAGDAR